MNLPHTLPWPLIWLLSLLVPFSLAMLAIATVRWSRRRQEEPPPHDRVRPPVFQKMEILLLAGLGLLLYGQVNVLGYIFEKLGWIRGVEAKTTFILLSQVVIYILLGLLLNHLLGLRDFKWPQAFGFRRTSVPQAILIGMVTWGAVIVPVQFLSIINVGLLEALGVNAENQTLVELFRDLDSVPLKVGLVILATVGAPVVEELLFRGVLYPYLKSRFGLGLALIVTSLLFSVFHLHPAGTLPLFTLAVAFTLAYEWRGNLLAAMVAHGMFNGLSILMIWSRGDLF